MKSRRVYFYLLMAIALLFAAATGSPLAYFVCAMLLVMLLISGLSLLLVRLRFRVEQTVEPREAEAGQEAELSILLTNPYPFPFPQLEAEYTLPGFGDGESYLATFTVLPLQRIRIRERMPLPYRGDYAVGLASIKLYDVFGLYSMTVPFEKLTHAPRPHVLALPRMFRVGSIPLPRLESPVNAAGAADATEDPSSMADVRPYVPGDPVKRIHWKLSARSNQLLVKRYEPAAVSDALIYLDASLCRLSPEEAWAADDVLTSAALSLAAKVLEQGIPVQLIHREERLRRVRMTKLEELSELRRELARLRLDGLVPLEQVLAGENANLMNTRFAWVLTREMNASLVDCAQAMARSGTKLVWILCQGSEAGDADPFAQRLRRQQIPVLALAPGDDLAAVLAALA